MDDFHNVKKTALLAAIWVVIAFAVLTTGTFAWFTRGGTIFNTRTETITETVTEQVPGAPGNNNVWTGKALGKVGVAGVELQFSKLGGENFKKEENFTIPQTNGDVFKLGINKLMPVSTADLKTFLYTPGAVDGKTLTFTELTTEEYIYHGQFFIQAKSSKPGMQGYMKIYLDVDSQNGGNLVTCTSENGTLQNVLRFGMIIDDDYLHPYIFDVSYGDQGNTENNTYINGQYVEAGNVLTIDQEGKIISITDPSVHVKDYDITRVDGNEADIVFPSKYLLETKFNIIHKVDVFVYMEGCDPECIEDVEAEELNMFVSFYGAA